ncbi:T9SS type A sorting domain-containing protein [Lishizhenia tianjinensis]|nr:T9SS type A sorting domain-containing protein [Lishizhenia tianjinensis]
MILLTLVSGFGIAQTYPGNVSSGTFEMWLKADDSTSILNLSSNTASNGEEVSQWSDQSGNRTNNATNNNEVTNPIYSKDSATVINYNPALTFDGISSGLNFGNDYIFPDAYYLLGIEISNSHFEGINFYTVQKPTSIDVTKNTQFIYDIGNYDSDGFGLTYDFSSSKLYTPEGLEDVVLGILSGLTGISSSTILNGTNSSGQQVHTKQWEPTIARANIVTGWSLLGALLENASKSMSINGYETYYANDFEILKLNLNSILCSSSHSPNSGPFTIGRQAKNGDFSSNSTRAFEGQIAEIIGYSGVLSDAETNRIESYLALKYGITLEYGGTENGNYTASDGTTVWSANSASSTYHNNIIGIARDDASGLLQKQSHTQDDSLRIYLDVLDTLNAGNQGSFSNDLSFLLIGDNLDNLYSSSSYSEKPYGFYSRLDREWRIQSTNFTDTFSIDIVLNEFATINGIDTSDLYFIVDNDGDFSTGANSFNSSDGISFLLNGNVLSISGLNTSIIPNNSSNFFTIGSGSGNTPLPVELMSFTTSLNTNNQVQIIWTTSTEINNDYYSLYHSTDAEHWVLIEKIKGAGNSVEKLDYEFTHNTAHKGINYYQLKQTDFDGKARNLGVRSVNLEHTISQLEAYPNPVKGALHIRGNLDLSQGIYAINSLGIAIKIHDYTVLSEHHIVMNVAHLNQGSYFLKINQQTIRFTKL